MATPYVEDFLQQIVNVSWGSKQSSVLVLWVTYKARVGFPDPPRMPISDMTWLAGTRELFDFPVFLNNPITPLLATQTMWQRIQYHQSSEGGDGTRTALVFFNLAKLKPLIPPDRTLSFKLRPAVAPPVGEFVPFQDYAYVPGNPSLHIFIGVTEPSSGSEYILVASSDFPGDPSVFASGPGGLADAVDALNNTPGWGLGFTTDEFELIDSGTHPPTPGQTNWQIFAMLIAQGTDLPSDAMNTPIFPAWPAPAALSSVSSSDNLPHTVTLTMNAAMSNFQLVKT